MSSVVGCVWSLDSSVGTHSRIDAASNYAIKKSKRKEEKIFESHVEFFPAGMKTVGL